MTLPIDNSWGFETTIVPAGEGERYDLAAGDEIRFKVTGAQSGGGFTLFEFKSVPGHPGIPHHMHESHEEMWHILEGTLQLRIEDEVHAANAGETFMVPRGIGHSFWTEGEEPSRMLSLFCPAGFEGWFRDRTRLLAEGKATREALIDLSKTYDQILLGDIPSTMVNE